MARPTAQKVVEMPLTPRRYSEEPFDITQALPWLKAVRQNSENKKDNKDNGK